MSVQIKGAEIARTDMPRVICLEWIEPPMVAANWMPELVMMAGGEPGLTQRGAHSTHADWQKIIQYDPQVIVIMPCGFDLERTISEAQVLSGFAGWENLSAVRNRRVFAVDGNAYFNRSGPRLVDSLEILAHLLHPESFRPPRSADAAGAWRRLETRGDRLVSV
jgi:iron complex transport system substrate-binding protein